MRGLPLMSYCAGCLKSAGTSTFPFQSYGMWKCSWVRHTEEVNLIVCPVGQTWVLPIRAPSFSGHFGTSKICLHQATHTKWDSPRNSVAITHVSRTLRVQVAVLSCQHLCTFPSACNMDPKAMSRLGTPRHSPNPNVHSKKTRPNSDTRSLRVSCE